MKLRELLKDILVLESNIDNIEEIEITGISYDSRETKEGDVFVAIIGYETDGHKYIDSALKNGASAIICQEKPANSNIPYILVEDSRLALALTSKTIFDNPSDKMKVIAVTGTNGKTTTTYLLKHMIETKLNVKVGLVGTNGNMIGDTFIHSERTTPESYELQKLFSEMYESGCEYVVMEVSSHSLVLERVAGITFETGIFTNLTQDHLDFHKTMENYAEAKSLLFSSCKTACINADDEWSRFMIEKCECPTIKFSANSKSYDLTANDIRLYADGVKFSALYNDELSRVHLHIPGKFSVYNALGVLAAGIQIGIPFEDCCESLESATGVKGRMEVVPTDGNYTIIIDYCHTPDALENAITTLKEVSKGRVVALFGCGGDRDRTKRPKMGKIAADLADFCIVTSDNPRTEEPEAIIQDILEGMKDNVNKYTPMKVIADRPEAIRWAIDNHEEDDVILLAGKGHEDYQIIGHTKHHMDEREIVAEHLERRKENR